MEIIELINNIFNKYPLGGALHLVIHDGNVDDGTIKWCITEGIKTDDSYEKDREMFIKCAEKLLSVPESWRLVLIENSEKIRLWKEGDLVIYCPPTSDLYELGKIKRLDSKGSGAAFVYYSSGETAARTPLEFLRRLKNYHVIEKTHLGSCE